MRNAGPVAYLRYQSKICPNGRKPVTKRIVDVDQISPLDIIVAIKSPANGHMFLHLDRENGRVWYLRRGYERSFTSLERINIGINGEFLTP
jgi:hypothetical protein